MVDEMNVIFSIRLFFEIGKVAIKLHDAFEHGISAITQPCFVQRIFVTLPIEVSNLRRALEHDDVPALDIVGLDQVQRDVAGEFQHHTHPKVGGP